MAKKTSSRQGKAAAAAKTAGKAGSKRQVEELEEEELDAVSGGFNPQPDPPGKIAQLVSSYDQGLLVPAVMPLAKKGS
jgi:hypothetical protein